MAGEKPERDFSMYPWLGTAIHKLIEHLTDKSRFFRRPQVNEMAWELFGNRYAQSEMRIFICNIPGYGEVYGNIDFTLPDEKCIIDWKSSSRKKIAYYKLHGVPIENQGQTLMYLHGVVQLGYDVESAVLVYVPRDAATLDQLWAYEVFYNAEEVQQIIDRAAILQQWIDAGRHHELPSNPECYVCHPGYVH